MKLLLTLLLTGCAVFGPPVEDVSTLPEGEIIITEAGDTVLIK